MLLHVVRGFTLAASAVALSGCATNALRLEYASDVAAKADIASVASRQYLAEVDRARVATNLDLVAIDPACVPDHAFVRRRADLAAIKDLRRPPRGWLCAPALVPGVTYDDTLSLAPLGFDLEPTFVLTSALGAYSAAMTKILDEKGPDPVQDLNEAVDLAHSAQGLLLALAGGKPVVPAADDKRLAAVGSFINFVDDLKNEQIKVKRLRRLVRDGPYASNLIAALQDHLDGWELSRASDENLRFVLAGALLGQAQRIDPPLPSEDRRMFARAYYEGAAARVTSGKFKPALDVALGEVAAADADLRRVLRERPTLSADEKRRVAQIARERVAKAFETLTQLILAFKGG